MNLETLGRLIANRKWTLTDLRDQDPGTYTIVIEYVGRVRKNALAEALADAPSVVRAAIEKLDAATLAVGGLLDEARRVLDAVELPDHAREATLDRVARAEQHAPGALDMTVAVERQATLRANLARANAARIALAAKVRPAAIEAFVAAAGHRDSIDDASISALVDARQLTGDEAAAVGRIVTLENLANGDHAVAAALATARFPTLSAPIADVRALLDVSVGEMAAALRAAGVQPPAGSTHEQVATDVQERVVRQFPTEALRRRLAPPESGWLDARIATASPLLAAKGVAFGTPVDELDLSSVEVRDRAAATAAYGELLALTRRYPGLGLEAAIADSAARARDAAQAVAHRTALVDKVARQNPELELLALDYSPDSADLASLDLAGVPEIDRAPVLSVFKAHQRLFALTNDPRESVKLLEAGYSSALAVGNADLVTLRAKTGMSDTRASEVIARANETMAGVSLIVGSVLDIAKGGFHKVGLGNVTPEVGAGLRALAGYADLFGPQDNCDCSQCSSILSPAAYFVDLMYFVEQHVLTKVFTGARAASALNLKSRRPDLWSLDLSCANTNTLIPTLDVIVEVLESYLAKKKNAAIDLADRQAVKQLVYGDALATTTTSFVLPFVLPVAAADAYLALFDLTREDIVRAFGGSEAQITAAALATSKTSYDLVTTPNTALAYLRGLYGLALTSSASGAIDPVGVPGLLAGAGLTHAQLQALTRSRFVTANGAAPVTLRAEKASASSVQNDVERVHGLTAEVLDRIHRLVRAWRQTSWSIDEVDLVLAQRAGAGAPVLDGAALGQIVETRRLADRFALPVDAACALWSDIPTQEVADGPRSLFNRLFNTRPYTLAEGALPKDGTKFVAPAFRTTPLTGADHTLQRLLLGLQVDDAGLAALVAHLATRLGCDPTAANEADRGFALSLANLSLLYRHARLARLLGRPVAELFQALALAGVAGGAVTGPADLTRLLRFDEWVRTSGLTIDEVAYVTRAAVQSPERYPDAGRIAVDVVAAVASDRALEFADTVLAFAPGVTEEMSRLVIERNGALFERGADGMLRLGPAVGPATVLTVPAGVPASAADLTAAVMRFHAGAVLLPRLAAALRVPTDKLAALAQMAGVDPGDGAIVAALHGGSTAALQSAIETLARLATLFRDDAYAPGRLAFVRAHAALFGIGDFAALRVAHVTAVTRYLRLVAPRPSDPDARVPDPVSVEAALAAFAPSTKFAAAPAAQLGAALAADDAVVARLQSALALGADAIDAMTTLAAAVALLTRSGLDVSTLELLASDDPAKLGAGAEALVSALARKYPDERDAAARLEPQDNRLRSARRDALADGIIRASGGRFAGLDDLYDYFLLDVQLQGCARTSRVVAAISSVQTYVHRILLDLEQDDRPATAADHVHVRPDAIPEDEWSWRKNYRVWEANRKVFLWPENYIEPELRDDKTPLFGTLEAQLLQQDINEQNVLDAYGDYLAGFERVASLRIAGTYHEWNNPAQTDVLHVFGATPDDPPEYYYWTIQNLHYSGVNPERRVAYSPRVKIDVAIPARHVTPVVHLGRLFVLWSEVQTSPTNRVVDGESRFTGYKHGVRIKYTSLRLDGGWTPPQEFAIDDRYPFSRGGFVHDALTTKGGTRDTPRFATTYTTHAEPRDGYTLEGAQIERLGCESIWGDRLAMNIGAGNGFEAEPFDRRWRTFDPTVRQYLLGVWSADRRVLHVGDAGGARRLYAPTSAPGDAGWTTWIMSPSFWQQLVADINGIGGLLTTLSYSPAGRDSTLRALRLDASGRGASVAALRDPDTTASGVPGAYGGAGLILQSGPDAVYVRKNPSGEPTWRSTRIGTTIARDLSRALFVGGVDQLLDLATQTTLGEAEHLLVRESDITLQGPVGKIDFAGPLGVYYREIFFHIPFLIANNLNARQNFRAAQSWYHYIFDPTAPLDASTPTTGLTSAQALQLMRDRVWRYVEFRGLTPPRLREILTDEAAIEAYRKDPFNPHAIARLRLSAYQKSVVMKYVENLLDWGDSLFASFTMESVNEATVLYAMAAEILGRRPTSVGDCGEAVVAPKSYERVRPWMDRGSEFLQEVESIYWIGPRAKKLRTPVRKSTYVKYVPSKAERLLSKIEADVRATPALLSRLSRRPAAATIAKTGSAPGAGRDAIDRIKMVAGGGALTAGLEAVRVEAPSGAVARAALLAEGVEPAPSRQLEWKKTRTKGWSDGGGKVKRHVENDRILVNDFRRTGKVGWAIVRQLGPIFCVPENKDLLALWDRVEDRLFKIRNCRDITGAERTLALFAPEIDPRLLVRARAQGLSTEDLLGASSGNLPPYRFAYLIEKARQYAAAAQGFGAQLLAALEKRDVEELTRLRNTQHANLLKMTTRLREWELQTARDAQEQLRRQKTAVEYRRDYYAGLIETDLLPWERTQQVVRHASTGFYTLGALFGGTAGILHLIPQLGSPFAMKYGGQELGSSFKGWSAMFSDTAKLMDVLAASAGLEAGNERRREGWDHQQKLAEHELRQVEKQLGAAELRVKMAERSLELHERSLAEHDEIVEFFQDKFSNLGLYVWLSTSLQRIYRQAFNGAQAMARLAERAYRFERNDETTPLLQPSYWSAQSAGLLSGEALMADLLEMERRFVETNYRTLEVDQAFSLMQLAPDALMALREHGECDVAIPELAFDLYYPGHYRRRVRAVRLTIPCVTGPYTNVAATLSMKRSFTRATPEPGAARLVEVPLRHTPSVATSTAQNDSGVFDFSFRDERYMPFEGAGAVSEWTISLPKTFRPFDYRTITDVIVHISYTALADDVLRQRVEATNAALEGSILRALSTTPVARVVSFRQEFSSLLSRAMASPAGTPLQIDLDQRFLPIFLRGRGVTVARALVLVKPGAGATGAGFAVRLNNRAITGFVPAPRLPGYHQADASAALAAALLGRHTFAIESAGDFAPASAQPGGPLCDTEKLQDLALYVELTASA